MPEYFPESLRNNASFGKHLLKEYLQLMILDFISSSEYASGLCFKGAQISGLSKRLTGSRKISTLTARI